MSYAGTTVSGLTNFALVVNQLAAAQNGNATRATVTAVAPVLNAELWGRLAAKGADGTYWDFMLRWQNPGGGAIESFYEAEFTPVAGTDTIELYTKQLNVPTHIGTLSTGELVNGDYWAFSVTNDDATTARFRLYKWVDPDWIEQGTLTHQPTDPKLLTAGFVGYEAQGIAWRFDDLGGAAQDVSTYVPRRMPLGV